MSSPRRIYSDEFRREAVQLITKQGLSASEAASRLGISAGLLRKWKRTFEMKGASAHPNTSPRQPTALEVENARLRAENGRLRMEREILKKAATFFAKESK